ncbi:hypothetical protein [Streptococcus himalayensis]|nr:hypothetical protein [Streptococcus himalayensis]
MKDSQSEQTELSIGQKEEEELRKYNTSIARFQEIHANEILADQFEKNP